MVKVSASIMCGNPLKFGWELDKLKKAGADYIHYDMMDGQYVENIAMGLYLLKQMKEYSDIPFDVHMAQFSPEKYLKELADSNVDIVSVHPESTTHIHRVVGQIKDLGMKPSIALNPATSEEELEYLIEDLHMVLVMTVSPGFPGQKFITQTLKKIEKIRQMANERNPELLISVDGNINEVTIPSCVKAGADVLVAGTSSIFKGDDADYKSLIQNMKNCVK